jgi:hypothetical protein
MEFKGKKGKWKVEEMAQSFSIHTEKYDGLFIDCWGDGIANTSDEEAKANAILISKAPEMLEMLNQLIIQIETFTKGNIGEMEYFESEIKQAKKLIKEATQI